jgi:TRAP-type C4-dicarboxylate transport system substrate-binding protein
MSEALLSIRKGMVDGCTVSLDVLKPMKIGDVAKYVYMTEHSVVSFWLGMNKKKWESLPLDIQKVMDAVSDEWVAKAGKDWDKAAANGSEYIQKMGGEIITLSKTDRALKNKLLSPFVDDYAQALDKKGLPGKQIVNDVLDLIGQYN